MKRRPFLERLGRAAYLATPPWLQPAVRELLGPWPLTEIATPDNAAGLSRLLLDWAAANSPPNQEIAGSLLRLRARAREQERNNAYVASYTNLLQTNVVGETGFTHEARVRNNDGTLAEKLNDQIEEEWERWCESVTIDGRLSMVELLDLTIRSVARDGELFIREWTGPDFPCGYALEPVDADLIDDSVVRMAGAGPQIRMGVHVDRYGRPTGYQVVPGSAPSQYSLAGFDPFTTGAVVIPASEMIHLARLRRVGQSRGVTWLGPALISLKMLDGYEEAELVAARTAAAKMGFFTAKSAEAGSFGPDSPTRQMSMDAAPGTMEQLPKGWEFVGWDPQHPSGNFPPYIKTSLRKIASVWGCNYNDLVGDLENVNYSSLRYGRQASCDNWRRIQCWLVAKKMQRVYRRWLAYAALTGVIDTRGRPIEKLYGVSWTPRGWDPVDPRNDVESAVLAIRSGLACPQDVLGAEGRSHEEVLEKLAEFYALAKEMGVPLTFGETAIATAKKEPDDEPTGTNGNGNAGRAEVLATLRNGGNRHAA